MEKRQAQFAQMEAHCAKLGKEVKTRQESLADFNTVLDKVRIAVTTDGGRCDNVGRPRWCLDVDVDVCLVGGDALRLMVYLPSNIYL
jgi:hypothetical protein